MRGARMGREWENGLTAETAIFKRATLPHCFLIHPLINSFFKKFLNENMQIG